MKNKEVFRNFLLPILLVAVLIVIQLLNPGLPILSAKNIGDILLQNTGIALAALGLTIVMIVGEGDMAFAGMFSMLCVIFALRTNASGNVTEGLVITFAVAVACYLVMAIMIIKFKTPSFIMSIAFMFAASGVEKALHQQTTVIETQAVKNISAAKVFGLQAVIWMMIVIFIVIFIFIYKTKAGFEMRVVGESRDAAVESGINTRKYILLAYILAAVLLALGTIVETSRVGANYQQGMNYMVNVFAACYLGSSMFMLGRINVAGTFVGAFFIALIANIMQMMNIDAFMIALTQGVILIISVGISTFSTRDQIRQNKI